MTAVEMGCKYQQDRMYTETYQQDYRPQQSKLGRLTTNCYQIVSCRFRLGSFDTLKVNCYPYQDYKYQWDNFGKLLMPPLDCTCQWDSFGIPMMRCYQVEDCRYQQGNFDRLMMRCYQVEDCMYQLGNLDRLMTRCYLVEDCMHQLGIFHRLNCQV